MKTAKNKCNMLTFCVVLKISWDSYDCFNWINNINEHINIYIYIYI